MRERENRQKRLLRKNPDYQAPAARERRNAARRARPSYQTLEARERDRDRARVRRARPDYPSPEARERKNAQQRERRALRKVLAMYPAPLVAPVGIDSEEFDLIRDEHGNYRVEDVA